VLIETGNTHLICTASIEDRVPDFLKGKNSGWITAEYDMLPRATATRHKRERGQTGGRTLEIQRLIGRSLRSAVNLPDLGERTLIIDCDVIQADGGTRTAAITGGYVALRLALQKLQQQGVIPRTPSLWRHQIAAISLGIVDHQLLIDLNYDEDRQAAVDLNIVMTEARELIEIQGTAERKPFSRDLLSQMLDLAANRLESHFAIQLKAIEATRGKD